MARSITYWYDLMIDEKQSMSNLNALEPNIDSSQTLLIDLKSTSKVARWRLTFWCVAACAYAVDVVFDLFKIALNEIANKARYGTIAWWVTVAKEFQYGDQLSLIDLQFKYAVVNEANKIIKLAAAEDGNGLVNIKIATIVGGVKQPLTTLQYNSAKAYLEKKAPAGIDVNVINASPDDLRLWLGINYDPLILTDSGELISQTGTFPVDDAINEYLENLNFNGYFELITLIDFIQTKKDQGIKTAYVKDAQARYGTNPFVSFDEKYLSNAGYLEFDSANSVITYTASNV